MKAKIDVGLIGVGITGSKHLEFFLKNKNINKIYVSEKKNIKKKIKFKKCQNDVELKDFASFNQKNLVTISNYDYDHYKYLKKHIKKNHIFVEKPMCYNFNELKKIYNITKKQKFKNLIYSNLVLRSSSLFTSIKNKIIKGEFGKIYYFEGDYIYGRLEKLRKGWRGAKNVYSPILGGGIHIIDLMLNFFNDVPIEVETFSNKIVTKDENFKYDDFYQSNYKFKNNSYAKITTNYGAVHHHQHVIKIYGTKKTFIYDDKGPRIFKSRDPYVGKKIKSDRLYNGKAALLPNVIKLIKDKKNYKNEILNEINLMSVALASVMSVNKKIKIKIKKFND